MTVLGLDLMDFSASGLSSMAAWAFLGLYLMARASGKKVKVIKKLFLLPIFCRNFFAEFNFFDVIAV